MSTESPFSFLCEEFQTVIEFANQSGDDLEARRALIADANHVFHEAHAIWQKELKTLQRMLQTLKAADRERLRLKAQRQMEFDPLYKQSDSHENFKRPSFSRTDHLRLAS
ncbi:MAG: hypothetical protein JO119_09775 [Acidobacteria bacterium]|nr:hypothetical protein [Acidobacteriota bacterium]